MTLSMLSGETEAGQAPAAILDPMAPHAEPSRIQRFRALLETGPHVIDGGLAGELERRGHDLGDALWSARVLADEPQEILAVHRAFAAAGARVLVSASYQVSREGFVAAGRSPAQADEALRASVRLAREAAGADVLVAAGVGPFGAIRHDRSEYRGRYGVSRRRLVDFHAERLAVLADAGPDLLAVETIPDAEEADAIAEALSAHPELPAWVSFSCRDGAHTCAGQLIEEAAAAALAAPSVLAVGVNCTAPEHVGELLTRLSAATGASLLAYPNGVGDVGQWLGIERVALLGGCCGVGPKAIAQIARRVSLR